MVALAPLIPLAGKAALAVGKGSLSKAVLRSFATGAAFQAGAEVVAQLAEWARSIDGDWDSTAGSPESDVEGCREVANFGQLYFFDGLQWKAAGQSGNQTLTAQAVAITGTERNSPGPDGRNRGTATITTVSYGEADILETASAGAPGATIKWRIGNDPDDCIDEGPDLPDLPNPLPLPPIESGDCTINVNFMGFLGNEDGSGNLAPVFSWSPQPNLRASGGVIVGECNFQPTISVGGGGDGKEPPIIIPNPPDEPGSDDWWSAIVRGIVQGASAAIAASIVNALLNRQEAGSFTLQAPCDVDENGNPLTYTVDFPAESAQDRLLSWQVAQANLLQQHLDWKTPICRDTPTLEGDFRTISFRSDETSPFGKSRLRKRFRYRSVSGNDLSAIVDHWKDFTWEGGPYRVRWVGPTWRTPEVWAASEAEGQRVIQHASREAGFDPLETGEWRTRVSSSTRLGVVSNFRVDTTGGYYWITARDGSDQRPIVAR